MSTAQCTGCGANVNGGREACQAIWDEISFLMYENASYVVCRDLAFDSYCMQHPEQYGRSPKSYAAHLTRLCCGLEFNADPAVYAAIHRWLDGKVNLTKPALLSARGDLTVLHVHNAENGEAFKRLVKEWAESVWQAYHEQHALAHQWIEAALQKKS